ncbi:MAG: fatty acid desaturase [Planctomycetes bacterium]|nr:fatty acid desaturase [Planctomycetota bacterium]
MTDAATNVLKVPAELYRLRFGRFLEDFVFTWALIAAAWLVAAKFKMWWVWVPAVLIVGVQLNSLSNLLHDAVHWRVHPSRRFNDNLARWFLAAPLLLPLSVIRTSHLTHHRLLGDAADPDIMYYGNRAKATRLGFVAFLLMLFSGLQFLRVGLKLLFGLRKKAAAAVSTWDGPEGPVPADRSSLRLDVAAVVIAQLAIAALLWALTGYWWAYGVLWLLPAISILVGLNSLRTFCEHIEMTLDDGRPLPRLYTTLSMRMERHVIAPMNMNYHGEHHLQVAVPYYNLPKLREFYRENCPAMPYATRRSYLGTLRDYWRALPLKERNG